MIERPARKRDAFGRFAAKANVDIEALHADYDARELSNQDVAIKHRISASTLHRYVVTLGWTPRAPHRIDPNDLVMRMFAALEAQMQDLETTTTTAGGSHAAILSKLVTTLDRLIEIKDAEAHKRRSSTRSSKVIEDLRSKIADRIAEFNQP